MRRVFSSFVVWSGLVSVVAACGVNSGKDAESALKVASLTTTPAPAERAAADASPQNEEPSEAPNSEQPTAEPAEERDAIRKASRPPLELLTAPNVVFIFNFSESIRF